MPENEPPIVKRLISISDACKDGCQYDLLKRLADEGAEAAWKAQMDAIHAANDALQDWAEQTDAHNPAFTGLWKLLNELDFVLNGP